MRQMVDAGCGRAVEVSSHARPMRRVMDPVCCRCLTNLTREKNRLPRTGELLCRQARRSRCCGGCARGDHTDPRAASLVEIAGRPRYVRGDQGEDVKPVRYPSRFATRVHLRIPRRVAHVKSKLVAGQTSKTPRGAARPRRWNSGKRSAGSEEALRSAGCFSWSHRRTTTAPWSSTTAHDDAFATSRDRAGTCPRRSSPCSGQAGQRQDQRPSWPGSARDERRGRDHIGQPGGEERRGSQESARRRRNRGKETQRSGSRRPRDASAGVDRARAGTSC